MFYLVTGGAGSGKSEWAERFAGTLGEGPRLYLATMRVFDDEGRRRVEKHRAMRAGRGFRTLEMGSRLAVSGSYGTILLEDVTNLVMNEYYDMFFARRGETIPENSLHALEDQTFREISSLRGSCCSLIAVMNEIRSDGRTYPRETEQILRVLSRVEMRLAAEADRLIEVVYGIPVTVRDSTGRQRG
jgi:adenosylcobinamide kinase/adenosylcobinamide-phosphate guanylyltransferase